MCGTLLLESVVQGDGTQSLWCYAVQAASVSDDYCVSK